jgi:transcriptional antiterminator
MNIDKMKHLIFLVKTESTGTPKELSKKIQLSERMLYNYLKILKEKVKAPICYNTIKNTYYFSETGTLEWEWVPQKVHSEVLVG